MRAHFAAVKARLEEDTALAGKGYDSARLDTTGGLIRDTYWILFGGPPIELDDKRVTAPQSPDSDAEYLYTVRSVSTTADVARGVAVRVTKQLVGFTPVVAGRKCQRMKLDDSGPLETENAVKPPLFYIDQDFLLISRRG